jgi:hypothetical protein
MKRGFYIASLCALLGIVCALFVGCTSAVYRTGKNDPSFEIATRQDLVLVIKTLWPELNDALPGSTNIAIPYGKYYLPTLTEVRTIIYEAKVSGIVPEQDLFMCADFALQLHANVKMLWKEKGGVVTIAFGEAWGTRFNLYKKGILVLRGVEASHAVCFAVTRDYGIVLIEPTNGKIWKAEPGEDAIHFVKM